jgi:aspartate racemase
MHIGLIGGIGPASTLVYYDRLTSRVREAGGRLDMTLVQADVVDLVDNVTNDRRDAQAQIYSRLIDRLRAAGAACASITSIGGHFCYPETLRLASLPMVSAIAPLDDDFVGRGLRRVGLLGSEVVLRTRLYGQLTRTEAVAPEDPGQFGRLYQEIAVSGACTPDQRRTLIEAGRRMIDEQGAEAVVLAGTDLGLVFDGSVDPGYPVIDALDVHVGILADLALDRRALEGLA